MEGFLNRFIDGALLAALRPGRALYYGALRVFYMWQHINCTRWRYTELLRMHPLALELVVSIGIQLNGVKQQRHDNFNWQINSPLSKFGLLCNLRVLTIECSVGEPLIFPILTRLMRQNSRTLEWINFIIKDANQHQQARDIVMDGLNYFMCNSSPGNGVRWVNRFNHAGLHFGRYRVEDIRQRWFSTSKGWVEALGVKPLPVVKPEEVVIVANLWDRALRRSSH
ncbi:hypothetical protein BJ875DRAFT_238643 [Amylocarpus encephaloides]|uniref:Uncharacterized protein n=1 Tax=Amylocarpus encephaloides TaxID=45428 RepID=A0A9P7Y6P0_9HELO|nr:hypothetical protein BJ875DRAFT_238643 [Amylocarpus encephaloides]